jgi:hypothetical protein
MNQNNLGELIFNETDICDLVMQGHDIYSAKQILIDDSVDIDSAVEFLNNFPQFVKHNNDEIAVADWDRLQQANWHMPPEYKELDIAEYVLSLCVNDAELQRCGAELLLYQERDLFNLLRYLRYLVDVMTQNRIIWGVGRGSSVASFVLYKLGVHRINSLYYNLDINEFLR